VSRVLIERKLFDVAQRLRRAREELAVIEEQLAAFTDAADDARIRSLVSETPLAHREYTEAQRHADAMERSYRAVAADVAELQATQDELLDKLVGGDSSRS
jgi:phage terminase Nu1 subunit (DNA packaging protein)